MRALGKTPNDPLIRDMSPIQWRMCMLNVVEDESELNKKISDLVDLAIRMFIGNPDKNTDGEDAEFIGSEPTKSNPVVETHDKDKSVKKIMSTSFDEILESGGEYKGFDVEEIEEKPNA